MTTESWIDDYDNRRLGLVITTTDLLDWWLWQQTSWIDDYDNRHLGLMIMTTDVLDW